MALKDQLMADMKEAMKAHDKDRLAVIRMVRGAVRQQEIDGKKELEDSDVIAVISKEVKMRRDSIEEFNKGSRQDLVASANKNQIPIEGALVGIVRAILWAAKNLQGAAVDPDTPISVDWDDSYITDAETRMSQMRDDALSGLLPRYKYLSARYGVSEEDARKLAQEAADENKQPELSFGGGG